MRKNHSSAVFCTMLSLATTGVANAAEIMVNNDITTSTTWTANNTYNLQKQIYVRNGATLTIQAGTVLASTTNLGGSLAITRGSQIFVNGTAQNPVIMTSKADLATWTGGNPSTGSWRVGANEWGNLTIMGRAFISNSCLASNSSTCNVNNVSPMEGLIAASPDDPNVLYGGNQDNDDSGSISYLSLRYGGRVIGLANELNGLSLGGVGRNTEIDHVEIMNNVDDGIEIWGGTVNLKYLNIWNVGDDSLDLDQGWRGKIQFGLIVQGYSAVAAQGSGVGDNCIEIDGAEGADAQPITTATIYNMTVIGQPIAGDQATAWRDNARVQFRNCIFMDIGERLVLTENGDNCTTSYGFNGTLSWLDTWTTPYTYAFDTTVGVNNCNNANQRYTAQSAGNAAIGQGKLAEITDSVFFRNLAGNAYNNANGADAVGVTTAGGSNPGKANVVAAYNAGNPNQNMPIKALTRSAPVTVSGNTLLPVTSIDPRAANAAVTSISSAPNDGFFTSANYRGAFSSTNNWICGWTAASAFGFVAGGSCTTACEGDVNGSGTVDVTDLLAVITAWGPCASPPCAADIAPPPSGDGQVDVTDLLLVITRWGACP